MSNTSSKVLVQIAQAHARAILGGTMSITDVGNWVIAYKGEFGSVASAIYTLEIASLVPDSVEADLRKMFAEILNEARASAPYVGTYRDNSEACKRTGFYRPDSGARCPSDY